MAAAGDEVIKNLRFSPFRIQLYPSFKFFVSLLLDFQSVKMVRVCDDSINTKKNVRAEFRSQNFVSKQYDTIMRTTVPLAGVLTLLCRRSVIISVIPTRQRLTVTLASAQLMLPRYVRAASQFSGQEQSCSVATVVIPTLISTTNVNNDKRLTVYQSPYNHKQPCIRHIIIYWTIYRINNKT